MSRGKTSGHALTAQNAALVKGMQARGDREHDIAAWFGVNPARIADVKSGETFAGAQAANILPPTGAPGVKGKRLRDATDQVLSHLQGGDAAKAISALQLAQKNYDANEA